MIASNRVSLSARRASRLNFLILALLSAICLVAYVDRVNLSVALIDPAFKAIFSLDDSDRGLVSSAFFWSYAALQIPAGWLVDRYGSRYPLAASLVLWSLLTAATSLATGFSTIFAIRLLLGAAEAAMHPASMRWISFNFPERQRGLAIGLFMSGSKFGPAVGATLASLLIEGHGWQLMFLFMGIGGLLLSLPWLWLSRSTDTTVRKSEDLRARSQIEIAGPTLTELLRSPLVWGTVIGTFSYMYFVYFCMTWMPAYFSDARGLSLASSSLYTTFSFAGMAMVAILGGLAADWLIARGYDSILVRRCFVIAGLTLGSMEVVGAFASSLNIALAISVISLSGLGLTTANYWALTQSLVPGASIGKIVGIQNCAASLPGILAPILTGWLVERTGSYTAPMVLVLVFLALGVASYVCLVRERYSPRSSSASNIS